MPRVLVIKPYICNQKVLDIPEQTFDHCLSRLTDVRGNPENPKGLALLPQQLKTSFSGLVVGYVSDAHIEDIDYVNIELQILYSVLFESVYKEKNPVCQAFVNPFNMTREAIVNAAAKMETVRDLFVLLNKIKMDELGENGHPFTMPQLNYFINPKRSGASYRTFSIPKKSGGVRMISAPVKMLKSFQTYVGKLLQAIYDAPDCVTGFVPEKSVVDNANRHVGMRYIFNIDLKDFFPSITQARVWGALKTRPFCFPEKVASAIAGLCCIEVAEEMEDGTEKKRYVLPQGSPCSPVLTNIVCHNLDWKLHGLAKRFHLNYSRYADDITFSGDNNLFYAEGEFVKELRRIIAGQNFRINEKKTRLQKRGDRQEVTGLVVSDRVNVSREYVRDIENLLYIWEKYGHNDAYAKFLSRYQPKQNYRQGQPDMNKVVMGRLMYMRMVKGEESPAWRRLQKRFNRLVDRNESCGGTDIRYLHSYTIENFERIVGVSIRFTSDTGKLSPSLDLNGSAIPVRLSHYSRKRLKVILDADDADALEVFKAHYHIAYCRIGNEERRDDFLMIIRKPPKRVGEDRKETINQPEVEVDGAPVEEPVMVDGLTTDQVLEALVVSGFDLTILDKWDKTKTI